MYHRQITTTTTMKGQMPTANPAQNTIDNKIKWNEKRANGNAHTDYTEMNKSDNKFENQIDLTRNQ